MMPSYDSLPRHPSDHTAITDDKVVLITGGTGSFGRAFVELLLRHGSPRKVIVFSRDEQKHYQLDRDIRDPRLRCFVGDIRDRDRLRTALRGVDLVVHAAAMKHVPICEYNPIEAVQTNVTGARNLVEAAIDAGVERVIALSTDKAVAPANLYGATKLCMEKLLIAANAYAGDRATRFAVVRYGNVMGSAGSVIPLFAAQRARGLLTITDERMTRFWIGMDDAMTLVLRGLALMTGGEIFVPKLPTTDIVTLAEAMAPGIPRDTVGIRPGEKLHETLLSIEEARRTRDLGELLVIWPEFAFHAGAAVPTGTPLPEGFAYSSDVATPRLDVAATRALLGEPPLAPPHHAVAARAVNAPAVQTSVEIALQDLREPPARPAIAPVVQTSVAIALQDLREPPPRPTIAPVVQTSVAIALRDLREALVA